MTTTDDTPITEADTLDASDLDKYMGVPMEPGELKDPIALNDIRRWVQAMHYPNPLHYDEVWAEESRFGKIIAPQSYTVATDTSHGCSPAQVGKIPNSHLIFGGDDWWFFGPRIEPGDHFVCHRMPYDYKVTTTSFAGPTCFQRGDTLYINQKGERVAQQRSTAIRYQVQEAKEKKVFTEVKDPEWTDEQLAELEAVKAKFIDQIQTLHHDKRLFDSVNVGDQLAPNVLGPAQPGQLRHRVAGLPDDDVGCHGQGTHDRAGRGARLHEGDGRLRGRPPHGAHQPGAHRRRLLRPVARPPPAAVGAARRHAAWLRLRRVDGRLGPGLRGRVGGRVGLHHPRLGAVPQPRLHRRRHLPHRRGGRQAGAPQAQAPGHGEDGDAQPGRRRHGKATVDVELPNE